MVSINAVIAVAGAMVILLSLAGLAEIHSRAGPFDAAIDPVDVPLSVTGSYLARGPMGQVGPGGVCVPPGPCQGPVLRVALSLSGLPAITGTTYAGFLTTTVGDVVALGDLRSANGAWTLQHESEQDARAFNFLAVSLHTAPASKEPSDFPVFTADVSGKGQETPADLRASTNAFPHAGSGVIRAAEIGAFAKSTTAIGNLAGAPRPTGWTYYAWFASVDVGSFTPLGAWEANGPASPILLDARVENMRLEDQSGLLTTLELSGTDPSAPSGFPVFRAAFPVPGHE